MNRQDYRAIEVIPGRNCSCPLSKLAGKRMLYTDIAELLNHSAFYPHCTCTFKHYADRRQGIDRRNFETQDINKTGQIRNMPYGRRTADIHNRARDRSRAYLFNAEPSPMLMAG